MNIKPVPQFIGSALACLILLTGCGGGGGGDEGGSGSAGSSGAASTPTTAAASAQAQTLDELNISYDNNLESVYSVDVDVILSQLADKQAYISICDNSSAQGDANLVDYESCLVKSSLAAGLAEFDLRVVNHCDSLIALIWVMEPDQTPLVYTFDYNGQKENTWLIQ